MDIIKAFFSMTWNVVYTIVHVTSFLIFFLCQYVLQLAWNLVSSTIGFLLRVSARTGLSVIFRNPFVEETIIEFFRFFIFLATFILRKAIERPKIMVILIVLWYISQDMKTTLQEPIRVSQCCNT